MRTLKFLILAVMFCSAPLAAQQQSLPPVGALDQVVSKVTSREKQEMAMIRQHSPLVETYIQKVRIAENDGSWVPDGDRYFIGRAEFSKGLDLKALPAPGDDSLHHMVASLTRLFDFGTEFLPQGFLQMIYLDNDGLNTQNLQFRLRPPRIPRGSAHAGLRRNSKEKGGQRALHRAHLGRGPGLHDRSIQWLLFRPQLFQSEISF